jgi:MYXO-CTERM domain-containing protein
MSNLKNLLLSILLLLSAGLSVNAYAGPVCGDGTVDTGVVPPEQCDEGMIPVPAPIDLQASDFCNNLEDIGNGLCQFTICGDGVLQMTNGDPTFPGNEECDDGVSNSDSIPDACRTNCAAPSCGDNVVDMGEQCDFGASLPTADCDAFCNDIVTVPDVVGFTQAAAESAITGAGLAVGTVTMSSNATVPAGNVISQSLTAGTSVAPGTAMGLDVSTGPAPPPDSNGDGISDADAIALGLDPNDVDGDTDNDGMSDVIEVGGDVNNPLDSDNDGVIDALEPGATATDQSTASGLPLATGGGVIITAVGEDLSQTSTDVATGGPAGVSFPYGIISYKTTTPVGGTVTVKVTFPTDLPAILRVFKENGGVFTELTQGTEWARVAGDNRSIDVFVTDGDPRTDGDGATDGMAMDPLAVGGGSAGGGGSSFFGCSLGANPGKDPMFPLLLLASAGYLLRRRRRQGIIGR